jgi:hypothetical protein
MLARPHPDPPELSRWREELLSLQPVSDRAAWGANEPYSSPPPDAIPLFLPPELDLSRWREELYGSPHGNWHGADDAPSKQSPSRRTGLMSP